MRYVFGQPILDAIDTQLAAPVDETETRALLEDIRSFLRRRLTDAAKGGCHHCGEQETRYAPCHWCGLKGKSV